MNFIFLQTNKKKKKEEDILVHIITVLVIYLLFLINRYNSLPHKDKAIINQFKKNKKNIITNLSLMTDTQPLNTETITATKQSINNYKNHEAYCLKLRKCQIEQKFKPK